MRRLIFALLLALLAGSASAAVSVVSVGTVNVEGEASGTTTVVNFTAGFLENDLLIGFIGASENSTNPSVTHTWPGGWTEIAELSTNAGTASSLNIAWHLAASDDEISSVTATASATTGYISTGIVIRGQDLTTPIDAQADGESTSLDTDNLTAAITTTIANVFVVRVVVIDDNVAAGTSPGPGGSVLRFTEQPSGSGGDNTTILWFDLVEASSGDTGTERLAWTGDTEESISFTFGIRPAAASAAAQRRRRMQ